MVFLKLLVFIANKTGVEENFSSCDALFVFDFDYHVVWKLVLPLFKV